MTDEPRKIGRRQFFKDAVIGAGGAYAGLLAAADTCPTPTPEVISPEPDVQQEACKAYAERVVSRMENGALLGAGTAIAALAVASSRSK